MDSNPIWGSNFLFPLMFDSLYLRLFALLKNIVGTTKCRLITERIHSRGEHLC